MSWIDSHGLATRMDKLPLVLAGPILRRTETFSVSVWIALRADPGKLVLHIYDDLDLAPNSVNPILSSPQTPLLKLGNALFVALLTAEYPFSSSTRLEPGRVYEYNIEFPGVAPWPGKKLEDIGILNNPQLLVGGINSIAYTELGLLRPSFSLPPASVDDLRIIHTSCRKVHGGDHGDLDALTALDEMILGSANQPNARPHQLYFTGDQIYADDVSDTLLYMINDAETHIIGWQEILPQLTETDNIKPGYRTDARRNIIKEVAHLSVGDEPESSKSHLIKLSEYYLMHLFAWSPVLWVNEERLFPGWTDVFPNPNDLPVLSVEPTEQGVYYINKDEESFVEERSKTLIFWKRLHMVRRALANVPVYMICDDHEVTDDWFIDKAWAEEVLHPNNLLGRRIIQNAVSAYVVFQAWGNTPKHQQFDLTAQSGNTILKRISDLAIISPSSTQFDLIGDLLMPILRPNSTSYDVPGSDLTNSIEFSYAIDFNNFRTIVLDSRTRRFFPNDGSDPALLSEDALNSQIKANLQSLLPGQDFVLVIAPAPIIGHSVWEETVQHVGARLYGGKRVVDWEAWSFNKRCFEAVLASFNSVKRAVILSGDVHFSYTAEGKYWQNQTTGISLNSTISSFAQLTSSASKNSTNKTNNISTFPLKSNNNNLVIWQRIVRGISIPTAVSPRYVLGHRSKAMFMQKRNLINNGWNNFAQSESSPSTFTFFELNNWKFQVDPNIGIDWAYRIFFINDTRNAIIRGLYSAANDADPYDVPLDKYYEYLEKHQRDSKWKEQSIAVGRDCIGEVTFDLIDTILIVTHALWYNAEGKFSNSAFTVKPYTVHKCYLTADDNEEQPIP